MIANAVNLVDGLDGLAAGMVAITAGCFFIYVVRTPSTFGDASAAALLSVITVGICVGFLPWNFYPAKIFMGDTGSMLLGMLVALFTISGVGRNPVAAVGRGPGGDRGTAPGAPAGACSSPSSTWCWRWRAAPGEGRGSATPTRSTSTIA